MSKYLLLIACLAGGVPATSPVVLNAFSDFNCTLGWTERDGALGLRAGSGSGTCTATFPGESGLYNVQIKVQAERDGAPPYRLSINGEVVDSGNYPYAWGRLMCDESPWEFPDQNKVITAGRLRINKGDSIAFYGQETYPCGSGHGAYAKWHEIQFLP